MARVIDGDDELYPTAMNDPHDYVPVRGRRRGGAIGAPGSAMDNTASSAMIVAMLVLAAVVAYCAVASTMFFVHYGDINQIDDNDDRLDDIDDAARFVGADIDFLKDVEIEGDLQVNGKIVSEGSGVVRDYIVCSDGSVTEGTVVSLNEGCVTDGFDPHPAFVFDTQDEDVIDLTKLISLGSSNAVLLYSDADGSGNLNAKALRYSNGAYNPTVLSATVQGAVGSTTSWAGTGIDDGQTVFIVRNNGVTDDDVVLFRCVSDGTSLTCDSGVAVYSDVGLQLIDLVWLGSSGANHWFVVLGINVAGSVETRTFVATTTADAAIVGLEAAAVVVDADADYAAVLPDVQAAHIVKLSGSNSDFTFAIVYGGVDGVADISVKVHTLGAAPSAATPVQVDISGTPHVLLTRLDPANNDGEFWAGSPPGTNNVIVTFRDYIYNDGSILYSVAANPNVGYSGVTFTTPAGQGTVLQTGLGGGLDVDAERYQVECLSAFYCVVAYRAIFTNNDEGKVAVVQVGSDGAIVRVQDRASYSLGHPTEVALAAAGDSEFLLTFVEQAPGSNQFRGKLVRGSLNSIDAVSGEIHFGLSAKGQAPLGIAMADCVGTSMCSVVIDGVYEFATSSPLATLGHASAIYAYKDGSLGIAKENPTDPFSPSSRIGVYIGNGEMLVRPIGLDEPL